MLNEALIFFLCVAATAVGAISGLGGGLIIRPVLDIWSGYGADMVSFMSGCTVLAMAVVSLLKNMGSGLSLERGRGTMIALGAAAGGVLGKMVFDILLRSFANEPLVGAVQSGVLIAVALFAMTYTLIKGRLHPKNINNRAICVIAGVVSGIISAFLGVGGGPVNLFVLSYLLGMDVKAAVLHSIYIILFSQAAALLRTLLTGTVPHFPAMVLFIMIVGGIVGGFVGSFISRRLTGRLVDKLFVCILVAVCGFSSYNIYIFFSHV